ncbi:hypothetical protein FE257_012825 [Aspergillus nanangensis]|uniref:Chromosome segregation ATPase family protein n=1 Tax=Aspergillus nanangensis TaxID=2582783 RepID=A0AAD4CGR8_ASPNN|nr:hypothetical protein FE257_012825 [Aspergillus nanangensis]
MPSHTREASHDRELVLRNQAIPMWDSSDPERAPPPLPMNPGSTPTSPATTRANVSPGIQAVAANFTERARDNTPSPYTTNPMPLKSSPEKSLIKGQFHKRMQSLQNTDTRSEFLNYLENKSPERPQRATVLEPTSKPDEKLQSTPDDVPGAESERDMVPNLYIPNRYLSKPILGESTPPSATMLALQNMQVPGEGESQEKNIDSDPFSASPRPINPYVFESLSTQILGLTDIASSLQREMAQLSRRSKDNATDLVSLKAATNARDEDIRKSLRDLSSNLTSKFLDADAATREPDSSPTSRRTYPAPRMPSPNLFASAMERELCGSPGPISDGSASIALLEKVLREMATKEGQEKLVELVDEIKARPTSDTFVQEVDHRTMKMLEEILNLVKEDSSNKALVRSRAVLNASQAPLQRDLDPSASRSRDIGSDPEYAPDMDVMHGGNQRSMIPPDNKTTDEMLSILKRVKNSVIESGGMTNEVKALVRELRGEVLGMGRNLARQFEDLNTTRSIEDSPQAPGREEISAIVDHSLYELRNQMASIIQENRRHSSALSEFRATMDTSQIYSIVKHAVDEIDPSRFRAEPQGDGMQKDEILETVREAWETYKPEIELQNFGLERDEILECLSEGLRAYQPQHDQAVTYDQVLVAVQAGMQNFEQPPSITKEEIIHTIRECLETSQPAPRSLEQEHLGAIREEVLQAVTESVTSQSVLTRESFDSGLGREEILSAVSDSIEAHFSAVKDMDKPHVTKDEVMTAINDAFTAQQSAVSTNVSPTISREDILSAIAEGLEQQNSITREIELNKDDLMEAISAGLHEATASANHSIGGEVLERLHEQLDGMKDEMRQSNTANEKEISQVLDAVKDGIAVVRQEVEGYTATVTEASGKHEIMDTIKEGLRLLQADMEKTITETALSTGNHASPDTPELLDAMEREFEHLRSTLSGLLIRTNDSNDKDEILDAIREASENPKSSSTGDITDIIRQEFENLRESMSLSLMSAEQKTDKEDIISALRENLESFRDESTHPRDGGESVLSATGELLDAFNDGVGTIRDDLAKLLEQTTENNHFELLDTLKDGLNSLKADVEMLRQSRKETEDGSTTRGGELMLANVSDTSGDIEGLKSLISALQVKVEAIEAGPRAAEPNPDSLKKEHLDEVLAGLHELQGSVSGIIAREAPADEAMARKEDTDAIETLLRNTKSQLDEMVFPAPDEIAKAEQIGTLEILVMETKEALTQLSGRLEEEAPTKTEIGTLEALMKDMWVALDENKGKDSQDETDAEMLVKADLQTVEAMIFEVKTQVEELKITDPETLPTKAEVQDLTALVTEFKEKTEAENELTAQGFEARKVEHAGIHDKIEEARAVVEGLGEELKSKLDGSNEGLSELKQLLEGLAASAESFTTVENVNELTELINREFERARGEQDATKLENDERDSAAGVKHDETRAAIIVELGTKIDDKLGEVVTKYEDLQNAIEMKFSETIERDSAHLEEVTHTRSLAEDIKLVIGSMGNSVNEACERISVDTKTFFEKVDASYNKMEEMQKEVKTQQEQARSDVERAAAASSRVESQLHEFHPQVLESIQQILSIVGQHYDHAQKSTQDLKMDLSALPSTIPQMLPALPPPEPEKYDDSHLQEKLNNLLDHAQGSKVQEALNILVERVTTDQVHEKLDQLMSHTTSTNGEVYDKLNELLSHAANTNGPVHDKLDTLLDHAKNTEQSVTQMMKLDEMHKDIMETSRKMNEMFTTQCAVVSEENERKRREAEEAGIALERRNAQRDQVEAEIVGLKEEKDSLLKMVGSLKSEKEDLIKQNTKLNKELSGLEMALDLRQEEMQVMEDRADSLEKRILEGVLDHARSVLLSRPNSVQGLNMKKSRGRPRGPSNTSTASTAKEPRGVLGSTIGMALKKRSQVPSQSSTVTQANVGKERRILSLSNVTGNRGATDGQTSGNRGFASLKRSHSVKSNFSTRKASWGGRSSLANKENEAFPEEDENASGDESDTGTERRTSYTGTYADSMVYGTGSVVSTDRRVSTASSTTGTRSVADSRDEREEEHDDQESKGQAEEDEYSSDSDFDDAQTTKGDDAEEDHFQAEHPQLDAEKSKLVLYGQHSDSGLGAEVMSAVD